MLPVGKGLCKSFPKTPQQRGIARPPGKRLKVLISHIMTRNVVKRILGLREEVSEMVESRIWLPIRFQGLGILPLTQTADGMYLGAIRSVAPSVKNIIPDMNADDINGLHQAWSRMSQLLNDDVENPVVPSLEDIFDPLSQLEAVAPGPSVQGNQATDHEDRMMKLGRKLTNAMFAKERKRIGEIGGGETWKRLP